MRLEDGVELVECDLVVIILVTLRPHRLRDGLDVVVVLIREDLGETVDELPETDAAATIRIELVETRLAIFLRHRES